ncbi:hypothetical protein GMORB2_0381 [Geosmithia morbida]|uniref:Uncharacterized protein n=1 Tax=Geosmithia morbida TaxID=1094350 RepID=A0A9P4Z137_9HYPO|nr:uncharacterized protein GMORB2_0381 [Geosmithia morbida]KAF4126645.1 hypothetical protein GMORB2_0381 [Geosmithia morbida]
MSWDSSLRTNIRTRVKLPKTFLAVNLSDAFSFEEQERRKSVEGGEDAEMKEAPPKDLLMTPSAPRPDEGSSGEGGKILNP